MKLIKNKKYQLHYAHDACVNISHSPRTHSHITQTPNQKFIGNICGARKIVEIRRTRAFIHWPEMLYAIHCSILLHCIIKG